MSIPLSSMDLIPSFHAVMRTGSLSAAARQQRLSQPTVRRHIETLEAELGAALFTRAANGLTPTAIAYDLMPRAQAVLDEAQALVRAASATAAAVAGTVRITSSRVLAAHVMPRVLAPLRDMAPDLTVELAATDQNEDLLRRAADIAVRFAPPTGQALIAQKLPDVKLGLFASPRVGPLPQHLVDLADAPMVLDDRDGIIAPGLAALGAPSLKRVTFRSDDATAQIAALQAGLGIGMCQCAIAAKLGLIRVLPDLTHHMPAWLVMHEDQAHTRRVRLVFDHLKLMLPATL